MTVEWAVPVLKEAVKNRHIVLNGWHRMVAFFLGPQSSIAVVGQGGIGKSVLVDHITGKAFKPNYKLPPKSRKIEKGLTKSQENRLALTVAPGQGGPQVDAFNKVFSTKGKTVDGIIFVAGNGLVSLRQEASIERYIKENNYDLDTFRREQLKDELDYLKQITNQVRMAQSRERKPRWLMVAVTKVDLYHSDLPAAEKYYSPHGDSQFSRALNKLKALVGADNFEWDSAPVCSALEDFVWGEETLKSDIDDIHRDHYLAQMIQRIGEMCQAQ
ncbi:hypothetical protein [Thalassospira lucentensis]|uniref:hypothetical protein n=1 Tax=Thalassospira lucentensis TaxID=168935 RepID=UPI003AA8DFD0